MAAREEVSIAIYAGTFASQPLAFAHLYDLSAAAGTDVDLGAVEVICQTDPAARLAHYLDPQAVNAVIDAMGLHTTAILVFPEAGMDAVSGSEMLVPLGTFWGTRLRA